MRVGRFRGRKDVRLVLMRAARFDHPSVSLRCQLGKIRIHRVAVICPKRFAPQSVKRNRIKRVFFESAALILRDILFPVDCVIIIRGKVDARNFGREDADSLIADPLRNMVMKGQKVT